jgi:hypothetical protein
MVSVDIGLSDAEVTGQAKEIGRSWPGNAREFAGAVDAFMQWFPQG